MDKKQRTFMIIMGTVMVPFTFAMATWMLFDAYRAVGSVSQQPLGQFLSEPIIWHKLGEILITFLGGFPLACFFVLWKPALRSRYLQIAVPLILMGGVLNLIAAWGYYQKPRTDFTAFMVFFGPTLFLMSLGLPLLLRWMHTKRLQIESKIVVIGDL